MKAGQASEGSVLQGPLATARRTASLTLSLLLATTAVGSACQIVGGYQAFTLHPCHVLPGSKTDDAGATLVLSKQSDGTCYWIDKTEVTVEQYNKFVATARTQPITWDPACAWKTWPADGGAEAAVPSDPAGDTSAGDPCASVAVSMESEPFVSAKPIRCVDWCDAKAFCNWLGEELCGGQTNTGSIVEPMDVLDQWGNACSANGSSLPYGNDSVPAVGRCNVGLTAAQCRTLLHQDLCAPTDVGQLSTCTGPSGTEDMIGNVAEWVLQCGVDQDGGAGSSDTLCQLLGGSFANGLNETCYSIDNKPRGTRARDIGLRCCAALTRDETNLVKQATGP